MRKGILIIVLSLALPASASAELPTFDSQLIVPGTSIGGAALGMKPASAIRRWGGNRSCAPVPATGTCQWSGASGSATLSFTAGKVDFIDIRVATSPKTGAVICRGPLLDLTTPKQIGLCSTDAQLRKQYPPPYSGESGSGPTLGQGPHTTSFDDSAGRFYEINMGTIS